MRIAVTGASGRIGRYVVKDLLAEGHEVTGLDLRVPEDKACPFLKIDLTDSGDVYQALTAGRAEAVIHLGAWANSRIVSESRTYGENVRGTFHVFQAASDMGIDRMIFASSAQVYGFAEMAPEAVPVGESHSLRPVNAYALSKTAGEQSADYFNRTTDIGIACFRFMGVRTPSELEQDILRLKADPAKGRGLLWTRLDARDAAAACRLALTAENPPTGPFNITGSRIVLDTGAGELLQRHWGQSPKDASVLSGRQSPMNCARAKDVFGFVPVYDWSEGRFHREVGQ